MGFGVKTWIFAAAAAVLNTFAMFYAGIFGVPAQPNTLETAPASIFLLCASAVFTFAEYVCIGRKDEGRERIYRFVQHNVLSFLAAYGGFIIYCAAHFQDKYVLDTVVFNSMIPACFQRFFLITVVGWLVCGVISLVNKKHGGGDRQDNESI